MTVGGSGKSQIGQCKNSSTWTHSTAVKMLRLHQHTSSGISLFYFKQLDSAAEAKRSFQKDILFNVMDSMIFMGIKVKKIEYVITNIIYILSSKRPK